MSDATFVTPDLPTFSNDLSGEIVSIRVRGVNHRTAPLEVRERFAHGRTKSPSRLSAWSPREEVERFWAWYGALVVEPVLMDLRGQMETVRTAELERALRRLRHLSPDDQAQVERFSYTLLNKFLHQPTIVLKEAVRAGRGYGLLEALKRLFGVGRRDDA